MNEIKSNMETIELVLLFFTRAFNVEDEKKGINSQIVGQCVDCESALIDDFFIKGKQNSSFYKNLCDQDSLDIVFDDAQQFWDSFKGKYNDESDKIIHENFNGKLKQLILKCDNIEVKANVYFFHHWFDRQVTIKRVDVVKDFVYKVVEQITKNNGNALIADLRLILHYGDFVQYEDRKGSIAKLTEKDIRDKVKPLLLSPSPKVSVYSYHHQRGYPIYDRVLNNPKLFAELCKENSKKDIEEYILSLFDPTEINEKFIKHFKL